MFKNYIIIVCSSITLLLTSCQKHNSSMLPEASVVFQQASGADTMQVPLSLSQDTVLTLDVMAMISGKVTSSSDHWVEFAIDSTQIDAYRAKYGNALLLSSANYFMYRPLAKIAAGASVSDSGKINIVGETALNAYTTYVLPIVIHTVDGQPDGAASKEVFYIVLNTGHAEFLSKSGWTLTALSSFLVGAGPTGPVYYSPLCLFDNDKTSKISSWVTDLSQSMPQYFAMTFNADVSFSALTYTIGDWDPGYDSLGGYPTSIKIEISEDGASWTTQGVYAVGDPVSTNGTQTVVLGQTTARYFRFTALAAQPYKDVEIYPDGHITTYYLNCLFMSDFELKP